MTSRPSDFARSLTRELSEPDEQAIDKLYGLEPVYEPGTTVGRVEPTAFVSLSCPYCGERYETQVDLTGGSFTYVEDCQICCQPIELSVAVNDAGAFESVKPHRMD